MKRDFLTVTDLTPQELRNILRQAVMFKRHRRGGPRPLKDRTIALVFQKPSMRTRTAFEVAILQLGGSVVYLGQEDIQLGRREPMKDVARVLSRYVDGIVLRTFAHRNAEEFARHARVPVINGLSDLVHPCQALADLMTIEEHFGRLKGLRLGYVGDGNNVLHSLMEGAAMTGMHVAVAAPEGYQPEASVWRAARRWAGVTGATLRREVDPRRAVRDADVVYTDVWVSMGKERERRKRLRVFRPYQLNVALLRHAKPSCRVMHCLPAHRGEEITEEVLEGPRSLIFEQAENRLYAHKALLRLLFDEVTR